MDAVTSQESVEVGPLRLSGCLARPNEAVGVVLLVSARGAQRGNAVGRRVAELLNRHHMCCLRMDLLTTDEQASGCEALLDAGPLVGATPRLADIALLGMRVAQGLAWIAQRPDLAGSPTGLFGAGAGAAAVMVAAAARPRGVDAAVCCSGRLDLASHCLDRVESPTLLVVGESDGELLRYNGAAFRALHCQKRLEVIPRASCGFEEAGALDSMAEYTADWFSSHLVRARYV